MLNSFHVASNVGGNCLANEGFAAYGDFATGFTVIELV